jgi:hypothetical protein
MCSLLLLVTSVIAYKEDFWNWIPTLSFNGFLTSTMLHQEKIDVLEF